MTTYEIKSFEMATLEKKMNESNCAILKIPKQKLKKKAFENFVSIYQ